MLSAICRICSSVRSRSISGGSKRAGFGRNGVGLNSGAVGVSGDTGVASEGKGSGDRAFRGGFRFRGEFGRGIGFVVVEHDRRAVIEEVLELVRFRAKSRRERAEQVVVHGGSFRAAVTVSGGRRCEVGLVRASRVSVRDRFRK
jgi:hypothetical protein